MTLNLGLKAVFDANRVWLDSSLATQLDRRTTMGLRFKFITILIIFSIFPLIIFFLINQKLLEKLGDETYKIAEVVLLQSTATELQESADNYTRNLNRELSHIIEYLQNFQDDLETT